RAPEIFFFSKITGRRIKPGKTLIDRGSVPPADPNIIQGGVADACEQVRLHVSGAPQMARFQQLQEHLVERVLGPASLARYRRRKQQERRAMPAIQLLDFGDVSGPHAITPFNDYDTPAMEICLSLMELFWQQDAFRR